MQNLFGGQHGLFFSQESSSSSENTGPGESRPEQGPEISCPHPDPQGLAPVEIKGAVSSGLTKENPPWTFADVLRLVLLAIVFMIVFSVLAISVAIGWVGKEAASELARDPKVVVPAQLAAYLATLGLMVFLVRSHGAFFWRAVRWNWPAARWVGYMAAGGILALMVQGASALLPIPKSLPIEHYFRDPSGAWLMAAFGVSLAPLMEELLFRGFLYPVVARRTGVTAAVVITAVAFAGIHAPQLGVAWAPLSLILLVGLVLTVIRARTRSVAASFLMHVGYNGMLFTLLYISTGGFRQLHGM
jgi:membrane protease YdiL (CAAX protease family)